MTNVFKIVIISLHRAKHGGLAQLARAPALQAGGHRFEPDILHQRLLVSRWIFSTKALSCLKNLIGFPQNKCFEGKEE